MAWQFVEHESVFHLLERARWTLPWTPHDYPDHWTQGETLEDLKEHLKDLFQTFSSEQIPGIRRVDELEVASRSGSNPLPAARLASPVYFRAPQPRTKPTHWAISGTEALD